MEVIRIADEMLSRINDLSESKRILPSLAEKKTTKEAAYEKEIAITIASLINGKEFILDGRTIKDPPNAVLEKLARGICWEKKLEMSMSEASYKNELEIIDLTKAQLNALQSINRNLSEA